MVIRNPSFRHCAPKHFAIWPATFKYLRLMAGGNWLKRTAVFASCQWQKLRSVRQIARFEMGEDARKSLIAVSLEPDGGQFISRA
jgi:hypothetical protein